jgi:hypothetical protein
MELISVAVPVIVCMFLRDRFPSDKPATITPWAFRELSRRVSGRTGSRSADSFGVPQQLQCLGAGPDRGGPGEFEHPQGFHPAVAGLRDAGPPAGQRRLRGGDRIEGVGLVAPPPIGTVGPVDLQHLNVGVG